MENLCFWLHVQRWVYSCCEIEFGCQPVTNRTQHWIGFFWTTPVQSETRVRWISCWGLYYLVNCWDSLMLSCSVCFVIFSTERYIVFSLILIKKNVRNFMLIWSRDPWRRSKNHYYYSKFKSLKINYDVYWNYILLFVHSVMETMATNWFYSFFSYYIK